MNSFWIHVVLPSNILKLISSCVFETYQPDSKPSFYEKDPTLVKLNKYEVMVSKKKIILNWGRLPF